MSTYSFSDEAIRQRLEAKGEPIPASPGTQVVLETAALQLVARVIDMSYGEGALPPESYFENLVLELAVWQKYTDTRKSGDYRTGRRSFSFTETELSVTQS